MVDRTRGTRRSLYGAALTLCLSGLVWSVGCGHANETRSEASTPPSPLRDAGPTPQDAGRTDASLGTDAGDGPVSAWPEPPSGRHVGATVYAGGTEFRVWAPNASAVSLEGEFNQAAPVPLAAEPDGYWSTRVEGAGHGQRYHFDISWQGNTLRAWIA